MKQESQQMYPPEPPISFPPATRRVMAEQMYPPEPPLSFPPMLQHATADQTYPPEPPLTFPVHSEPAGKRDLRAEAQTLTLDDLSNLSVGHAKAVKNMEFAQLYMVSGMFMAVIATILILVKRRRSKTNTEGDASRQVTFSDSYQPFLGE